MLPDTLLVFNDIKQNLYQRYDYDEFINFAAEITVKLNALEIGPSHDVASFSELALLKQALIDEFTLIGTTD